ncbi:hypothetical protein K474DRAFT_357049 [Panus rudis PR-1116 ss-1]|nr:hypothetical protein K474DRAFT_357049 [Panus rudis PR-1116 ss-1]
MVIKANYGCAPQDCKCSRTKVLLNTPIERRLGHPTQKTRNSMCSLPEHIARNLSCRKRVLRFPRVTECNRRAMSISPKFTSLQRSRLCKHAMEGLNNAPLFIAHVSRYHFFMTAPLQECMRQISRDREHPVRSVTTTALVIRDALALTHCTSEAFATCVTSSRMAAVTRTLTVRPMVLFCSNKDKGTKRTMPLLPLSVDLWHRCLVLQRRP